VFEIKLRGLKLTETSYLQYEVPAVYTAIPSAFYTGRDLHLLSLIANQKGVIYGYTWVH
jgi:hypothetical protein